MSQTLEYFEVQEGNVLEGTTDRYLVNKFIGSGSFGRVAKAVNLTNGEFVALKILKAKKSSAARREIEMLRTVQVLDSVKANLVQCFEVFEHGGFTCLAFEMLDRSLFQLMADRGWEPLSLPEIRPIAQQLLTAFDALKTIGVIHADLKADNIMLVNHQDQPFRVKLIDFGLSMKTSEVRDGMVIQVEPFRAPEVILGLPLSEAVDMWSLGCLLSLLFISRYLFGSSCQYQVLKNIVEIVGQPSDRLLDAGRFTRQFFKEDQYFDNPKWWLKTPSEYQLGSGFRPPLFPRSVNSLHDLMTVGPEMEECIQIADRRAFVSFLMCLLNTDPHMRISPKQALKHPFISMVHLKEEMDSSDYSLDSHEKMGHTVTDESDDKLIVEVVDGNMCEGAEAAADSSNEETPAEEEPSPDSDGSPGEAPKREISRLKRFKKFCSRAIRRIFRLRKT